jgi:hypothetical protein
MYWETGCGSCMRRTLTKIQYKIKSTHFVLVLMLGILLGNKREVDDRLWVHTLYHDCRFKLASTVTVPARGRTTGTTTNCNWRNECTDVEHFASQICF